LFLQNRLEREAATIAPLERHCFQEARKDYNEVIRDAANHRSRLSPGAVTLRLEGSMAAPLLIRWSNCWHDILARRGGGKSSLASI